MVGGGGRRVLRGTVRGIPVSGRGVVVVEVVVVVVVVVVVAVGGVRGRRGALGVAQCT